MKRMVAIKSSVDQRVGFQLSEEFDAVDKPPSFRSTFVIIDVCRGYSHRTLSPAIPFFRTATSASVKQAFFLEDKLTASEAPINFYFASRYFGLLPNLI